MRKVLAYTVPPGYRRNGRSRRPKLEPFTDGIDSILEADAGFGCRADWRGNPVRVRVRSTSAQLPISPFPKPTFRLNFYETICQ